MNREKIITGLFGYNDWCNPEMVKKFEMFVYALVYHAKIYEHRLISFMYT